MAKHDTLFVNLYGGPGTGKSTTMAQVFAHLKAEGFCAEMAPEFAKELVWGDQTAIFGDQLYVTATQHHRLWRLKGKVPVVVTDSPLWMGPVYCQNDPKIVALIPELNRELGRHVHYLLRRLKPYETAGRTQTEEQAVSLDGAIRNVLQDHSVPFIERDATPEGALTIALEIGELIRLIRSTS